MDPGYTSPPSVRPSPGAGRGRGRGHSSDESLVTVTGIFPKETVSVILPDALHARHALAMLLLPIAVLMGALVTLPAQVNKGQRLLFTGRWVNHRTYGQQLCADK